MTTGINTINLREVKDRKRNHIKLSNDMNILSVQDNEYQLLIPTLSNYDARFVDLVAFDDGQYLSPFKLPPFLAALLFFLVGLKRILAT
jgi:hypothetical protein